MNLFDTELDHLSIYFSVVYTGYLSWKGLKAFKQEY